MLGIGPDSTDHCTCQYWRLSSGEYNRTPLAERMAMLQRQAEERPAPGVVAYLEGKPVGWCGFGVRQRMERLVRSRTIPWVDDCPVWSIFCFVIRTGHRRQGLTHALLDGVIRYARRLGAPALEAYPIDPEGRRLNTTDLYVGTVSLFEAAGFHKVVKTDATSARLPRWLMRLEL
ncbi:MAG: GNAT family N-acetyltransferase [Actinomycetota bacterium]|nr:GNAT family N-acetyltransferase [Actinomycetota bacterium]